MIKIMTIHEAVEEFDLYTLYRDIIDSYEDGLEDPSLVSELYDLIDENEDEYEFWADSDEDYSESFERNLKEIITVIIEENDNLEFSDDGYPDDEDLSGIGDDDLEKRASEFGIDLDEDDNIEHY